MCEYLKKVRIKIVMKKSDATKKAQIFFENLPV